MKPQHHTVFLRSSSERALELHFTTLYIRVIYMRSTLYVLWKIMCLNVKSMWVFVCNSLAHPRKFKHSVIQVVWNPSSYSETTVLDALETYNMRICLLQTSYVKWKNRFRKTQYSVPTLSLEYWIFSKV